MMDELHLTEDDLKMIKRGETPATVETQGTEEEVQSGLGSNQYQLPP